jgi:periplasmic copper chaperone A
MHMRRFTLPTLATGALAAVALTAAPAGAHVTVTPSTTEAGAYTVLTFSVGHGCEGSPTTKLAIQMPEQIPSVTPTVNPRWDVEKVTEQLSEPVEDAHGNQLTARVSQVVYTARQPLADGYRDTVELSVQLPDAAGETLAFPVVQSCVKGETGWVETAAEGQDPHELEAPAPVVTITAASAEADHGTEAEAEEPADTEATNAETADTKADDDSNALGIAGLATGVAGIAVGGLALARTRKQA